MEKCNNNNLLNEVEQNDVFFSGEQINHFLLKVKAETVIYMQDNDKSQYFAKPCPINTL